MELTRREFLIVSAGAIACSGQPDAPADATPAIDGTAGGIDAAGSCTPTQSDLLGPFFEPGAPMRMMIAEPTEPGERLALTARMFGADCTTPLAGATVEVWQCDRDGNYHDGATTNYRLRGRVVTDASGTFTIDTIKPGNYLNGPGYRPAHIHFTFSHPDHRTLTTQIYFAGDPYLAPVDSCTTCGSDDAERIVALAGDAVAGWTGDLRIHLAAA
jgi:protocatechuate 3,4-dioxygenase beta subunit